MIDRRTFLQYTSAAAVVGLPGARTVSGAEQMPTRPIPRTGEGLPVIGLGNSVAFQQGDAALTRKLLGILTGHGGSYVDTRGPSRDTLAQIMAEDDMRDELFVGSYVEASGYATARLEIDDLRDKQGGGPLDLAQTADMDDLPRRWSFFDQFREEGVTGYAGVAKSGEEYHAPIMQLIAAEDVDFVQINYSLLEPESAERLLPMCADEGVAVVINRPFVNGRYFSLVKEKPLPDWAAEFDCESWAQFSLKFILAHPAVNCVLTETANPKHAMDNVTAAFGRLPDAKMQKRMLQLVRDFT